MLRLFQWLWGKAEAHGEQRVLDHFYALRFYHQQQAEIAFLREKVEPPDTRDSNFAPREIRRLSPQEHSAIVGAVGDLITVIERSREDKPNGR